VTAPILRSKQANDSRSSASGPIRALGWVMAAWCLGFAAVNIAFQVTGRFASGPYADLAAGLAVMDWIVVGLKLLGAAVAVLAGAVGYGTLALSYSRRTSAKASHAVIGVLGAPLVLGALLVAAPAALTAMGLLPQP
jgi:hypothetical protein